MEDSSLLNQNTTVVAKYSNGLSDGEIKVLFYDYEHTSNGKIGFKLLGYADNLEGQVLDMTCWIEDFNATWTNNLNLVASSINKEIIIKEGNTKADPSIPLFYLNKKRSYKCEPNNGSISDCPPKTDAKGIEVIYLFK